MAAEVGWSAADRKPRPGRALAAVVTAWAWGVGGWKELQGAPEVSFSRFLPGAIREAAGPMRGAVWGQGTILLRAAQQDSIAVPVCRGP